MNTRHLRARQDAGSLSISDVAEQFGVTLRTLRFYEQKGLISPRRRDSWTRCYSPEDVQRLDLILKLRAIGVQLQDISDILKEVDRVGLEACTERLSSLISGRRREIAAERESLEKQDVAADEWLGSLGRPNRMAAMPTAAGVA